VLDGMPLAIAHMPGPTYAPFTMAVALLALFVGALVEESILLAIGGGLAAFALFLWFRPQGSETLALQELGGRENDPERLPLAVVGPSSNGWWGMLVLLAVLATALATIVASYFYLDSQPESASQRPSGLVEQGVATLLALMATATAGWAARAAKTPRPGSVQLGLAAAWILTAAALALSINEYPWSTLDPEVSAYASGLLGVVGVLPLRLPSYTSPPGCDLPSRRPRTGGSPASTRFVDPCPPPLERVRLALELPSRGRSPFQLMT
jgi:hypothetical protein